MTDFAVFVFLMFLVSGGFAACVAILLRGLV